MARSLRANLFVPDARAGWVPFARSRAMKLLKQYQIDAVITTGPPHSTHFIGKWLKRKAGIRWIADFRDPWTDIHYNRVLPRWKITQKRDLRMEVSILREADEITVTAPGTARYFNQKAQRDYHTIPNGFDPDDFPQGQSAREKKADEPFIIRHVGSITETCIPYNLLKALRELTYSGTETGKSTEQKPQSILKWRMEFIGSVHPGLVSQVKNLGLQEVVTIRAYVPHREATLLMQQADMNVVVVHRSIDSRILIPGKLYDYLKAGRPVMIIGPTDGDAAAIVETCRIGRTFDYADVSGPAAWIKAVASLDSTGMSPGQQEDVSGWGKSDTITRITGDQKAIETYSRAALTSRFASLLHSVCAI